MKYKPDWPAAQQRLTALWHHEMLERPCLAVLAPQPVASSAPAPQPKDNEDLWLGPEYLAAASIWSIEHTWWGGEAIPSHLIQGAWVDCLGGAPHFRPETIWFQHREVDFTRPSPFRHDPASPWVAKYRAALLAVCAAAGRDDFLVGSPGGLPANDLLSMEMGTEAFLMALIDHPDWMAQAIITGAHDQVRVKNEYQAMLRERHAYWYGNAGWMPFWAPEPFMSTQSDVSCMLSPEMYQRFIVPELDIYGGEHNALWYHLDGGDARQHLPRLLSLPYLRVVQYTPAPCEPPNGPAHLPMYRQIQAAGKIINIDLPKESVEPLVRELDPALMLLQTSCASRDEGERLLEQSAGWAQHMKRPT